MERRKNLSCVASESTSNTDIKLEAIVVATIKLEERQELQLAFKASS
jgi:hypothetical protein